MSRQPVVRQATADDDAAEVREVVERAYADYVPRIGRRPAPMDTDYDKVLGASGSWVSTLDGRIVGVLVTVTLADHLLVDNLAVDPAYQRRGIGSQLLTFADRLARDQCLGEIRLHTNEAMAENLAFYPSRGYVETGRGWQDGFRRVFFTRHL